ncbi:MAG TPA: EamA family transporter [Paenibacillus sp.]|uniref:EamA family transporter n=1 Tax=Paenibacillus sp. TaxID=58172 RepID=UPI0028D7F2B6|nr:EamA family transporter [Paenibacillus sp.]HUC91297.1 EamA family transporter [Paenibacillus sp.]
MWLLFASLSAVAFGTRGVLYHWTSQKPINRNLLLGGVFFTGCLFSLLVGLAAGERWTPSAMVGVLMGLWSFLANDSMFRGFASGKASIVAILTALPSVVVVTLTFLIWGERLTAWQLVAFVVIVSGVLLVRFTGAASLGRLEGAKWGLLATIFFGLNDVSGKWSTLLGADTFPTLFFMFATGTLLFMASWLREQGKQAGRGERDGRSERSAGWPLGKTFGVGMLVGITNTVGMVLILYAFELGVTGLVSAVVALNVIVILLYTRLIVKESFSQPELIGMILAFGGVVLLRLLG